MNPLVSNVSWAVYAFIVYLVCGIALAEVQDEYKTQETSGVAVNASETANEGDSRSKRMTGQAAVILAERFKEASGEELGATTLGKILDSLHPSSRTISDDDLALTISERLATKINTATQILLEMKKNIINDSNVQSFTYPCPPSSYKKSHHHFRDIQIKSDKVTLNIPKSNFKSYIKNAAKKFNFKVKRQYYMAVRDAGTDPVCGARSNSRKLFHQHLQPQDKLLLLLVDGRLGPERAHFASALVRDLLALLQPRDSVGLLLVGNTVLAPLNGKCTNDTISIGPASEKNKESLLKYLSNVETSAVSPNVTEAMETVFQIITPLHNPQNTSIVYIGKESYLSSDIDQITQLIIRKRKETGDNIVITGCDVQVGGDGDKSDVLINERNVPMKCDDLQVFCGESMIVFNSSMSAGQIASLMMLRLPVAGAVGSLGVRAAAPLWEPLQKDLLIPFVLPVASLGLLVLDLYLSDLAEDIIYFNSFSRKHRAFIINFSGSVIAHSTYPRPEVISSEPRFIDISHLEPVEQFDLVKHNMLHNSSGSFSVGSGAVRTEYTWKWVKEVYVVCVVWEQWAGERGPVEGARMAGGVARELQHHRMDLQPPSNYPLCRHFQQVSNIHKGTLYLSPSSFQSPFQYLYDIRNGKDISLTLMQSYMAYLKDSTRLLSNPGLKSDIRNDVGILNPMLSYFKRQHIYGAYNKYIVRRYAASEHGVLVMFPGSIMESDFEPNRKPWFMRALHNPGKLVLTPPHLDAGGAGYIITVSQATTGTSRSPKPSIVLSMDMSMGYLYKMLLDSLPPCVEHNIKCFIMDDRGYLLSHPGLVDPARSGPVERQHVTHKESLIANDMLNHRGFVRKQLCKNYADGTVQRFYEFNTTLDTILTNLVHGEHCARYHISSIPGTNAFVGMVNSSCNLGAFCPCSVVDRLCLNCNRMEQSECECPCECSLPEEQSCPVSSPPPAAVPLCDFQPEKNTCKNHYFYNMASHLDSCFNFQCESYGSRSACLGVLGCEWCQLDRDGESGLSSPFCGAQTSCFGGVLGGPTPYGEGSLGQVAQDDLSPAYSAVGPIAGCIVALCLILALAVYCYKQNLTAELPEPYVAPVPEPWPRSGVRMSHLNSEDDIHDERSGHQDKLLLANEPVAPVSPYRVLTGYRRPNAAGESDHGYSTMTPHDDSEHQAFALVEPFLSPGAGGSPSPCLSTPRSSAADLPVTVLPCGKHNIMAPVTVHRHMEAT